MIWHGLSLLISTRSERNEAVEKRLFMRRSPRLRLSWDEEGAHDDGTPAARGKPVLALATPSALTLSSPSWAVLQPSGRLSQRDPLASPRVHRKQLPQRRGDRGTGPCGVCQCSSSRAKPNVNGFSCPCVHGVLPALHNPANAPPYVPYSLRPAGRAVRASSRGIGLT